MKKFSMFLLERQSLNNQKKIQIDHDAYEKYSRALLESYGVSSPVQLTDSQYSEYSRKLREFNSGKTYRNSSVVEKVEKDASTFDMKGVNLTKAQRSTIQNIINSAETLSDAVVVLETTFKKKLPKEFVKVSIYKKGDTDMIEVIFKSAKYTFARKPATNESLLLEKDVKSDKDFRDWAESYLKQAHGDEYDQSIADKTISDLLKDLKDGNYGELMGRLRKG